jgi:hypothetical protein
MENMPTGFEHLLGLLPANTRRWRLHGDCHKADSRGEASKKRQAVLHLLGYLS